MYPNTPRKVLCDFEYLLYGWEAHHVTNGSTEDSWSKDTSLNPVPN